VINAWKLVINTRTTWMFRLFKIFLIRRNFRLLKGYLKFQGNCEEARTRSSHNSSAARVSILNHWVSRVMRRLRFEDDIARSEASIETFRVLVSIERRIYVHPLKDHWEICFDRLSRSLAESCTIGTMRSHRSPVFTRSMGRSIVHY